MIRDDTWGLDELPKVAQPLGIGEEIVINIVNRAERWTIVSPPYQSTTHGKWAQSVRCQLSGEISEYIIPMKGLLPGVRKCGDEHIVTRGALEALRDRVAEIEEDVAELYAHIGELNGKARPVSVLLSDALAGLAAANEALGR